MSGSNSEITNTGGPASSTEPSMEEILASIRRILRDEQSGEPSAPPEAEAEDEEILVLDSSMAVRPPAAPEPAFQVEPPPPLPQFDEPAVPVAEPYAATAEDPPPHLTSEPSEPDYPAVENATFDLPPPEAPSGFDESFEPAGPAKENFMPDDSEQNLQAPYGLVGESASEAAASSIGSLIRSISSERAIAIGRPGLTLEDLVREELRPLLKSWLDSNLPALVERIVRAEIQRVVERTGI